jgi:hypothetical protein
MNFLQEAICEWMPPNLAAYWAWPYWALMALVLAGLLLNQLTTRRTPMAWLIAISYFAVVSSAHQRHLSYFCLLAVPALSMLVFESGRLRMGRAARWAGMGSAALLLLFEFAYIRPFALKLREGWFSAPASDLADFLGREADGIRGKRLYNAWGDGGYLAYRLAPRYSIFFDGRYLFHSLLSQTAAAARSSADWRAWMDRYEIEVACISRSRKRFSLETVTRRDGSRYQVPRPYYVEYMPRRDWALVYWDARNLIMVRRGVADPEWVRRHEYRWLWPDDEPYVQAMQAEGRVSREALRMEAGRLGRS